MTQRLWRPSLQQAPPWFLFIDQMRIRLHPLLRLLNRGSLAAELAFSSATPHPSCQAISSSRNSRSSCHQIRHLSGPPPGHVNYFPNKIGNREVVGFGINGKPDYVDSAMFPYPAIRFREINPDYKALKEKEKGSWRMLTVNEKKCLYRITFCKTIAEIEAPTGEWKKVMGSTLLVISGALWFYMFIAFINSDRLPETFDEEREIAQLKRILDLQMNPIEGIASKWDYETDNWKGKPPKEKPKKKKHDDDD